MTSSFQWHNAYPSQRSPLFARNVVATSHPLAAQAGLQMLRPERPCIARSTWI